MAAVIVGSPSTFVASSATAMTAVNPQTPTAGNLLLLGLGLNRGSSLAPTASTPTGWNAVTAATVLSGTIYVGAVMFWRVADGTAGDNAPVLAGNWTATSEGVIEEWAGLAASSPLDVATVGATNVGTSGTLAPSYTTTNATDWIWTFMTARSSGGATFTPDGTYTTSLPTTYNSPVDIASYYQSLTSTGTINPGIGYTAGVAAAATGAAFQLATAGTSVIPQSMLFAA